MDLTLKNIKGIDLSFLSRITCDCNNVDYDTRRHYHHNSSLLHMQFGSY